LLFNIVPAGLPFSMVNQKMSKKPIFRFSMPAIAMLA